MSGKSKLRRGLKWCTLVVVLSLVLWLLPLTSLSAGDDPCDELDGTSGPVPNKHAGDYYVEHLDPNECEGVALLPGQVLWHLILTNWVDLKDPAKPLSITIDGVAGTPHGGAMHWTFINYLTTAPNWIAQVTNGLDYHSVPGQGGCVLKTELKVSHTCYGGDIPTGCIKAHKVDGQGVDLSGAVIGLYTKDNDTYTKVAEDTSDASGMVEFCGHKYGTYYVHEISAPAGFDPDTNYYMVELNADTVTLEENIKNTEEKLYKIEVMKTTTNVPAATDFVFNLVGPSTDVIDTITASDGSSGTVTFSNLKAGSYTLTETAPGGFDTWVSFSPDPKTSGSPGKSIAISIPGNVAEKDTVYVYFHNDPGTPPPPPPPPTYSFSVEVTKATSGSGFTAFDFTLQKDDGTGTFVNVPGAVLTGKTAGGPYAFVPSSPLVSGTYRVVETNRGGATNTAVSLTSMPTTASGDNSTSPTFAWDGASNLTQSVYFLNDIPGKATVVTVAGVTEEVEVLGIEEEVEELPYTGFNFIFSLAGILLIMAGGILAATIFLPRKKGEIS